jgi:uncharacterized protein YdhG (YjbR/CyaY superfamily)
MAKTDFKNVDEYNNSFKNKNFDKNIFERLSILRKLIHKVVLEIEEKISYQIPTFLHSGILCHYAAFKNHISFVYPFSKDFLKHFENEMKEYKFSKAALQLPNNKPFPEKMLESMIKFRVEENNYANTK